MDMSYVYVNKRRFVDLLSEAYELDGTVRKITYTRDPEAKTEIVSIEYPGGAVDRINVALNSHQAIAIEIARQIYTGDSVGLIRGRA